MRRYTLTNKIILTFLIVMIPLMVAVFGITEYVKEIITEEVSKTNENLLDYSIKQVESNMESVETYLYKMKYKNMYLVNWDSSDYKDYIIYLQTLRNQFQEDLQLYSFLDEMFIYDNEKNMLITSGSIVGAEFTEEDVKRGIRNERIVPWQIIEQDGDPLLYKVMYVRNELYIGVMFRCDNIMPEGEDLGKGTIAEILTPKEAKKESLPLKDYLVVSKESEVAPITVRISVSKEEIFTSIARIQKLQLLLPIFVILISGIYIWLLHHSVVVPVQVLEGSMKEVGKGNWNTRIAQKWEGEFSNIAQGFNEMVEQIHTLKIDTYDKKIKLQRAEYRYLQMQINPHFYLNTLNILYNMSVLNESKNVQKLALYLSNHFKYIMKAEQHLIDLNREIEYSENYLRINQMRFGQNLTYQIHVEPEENNYFIPMITIQTFVENSIIHGFKNRSEKFEINIWVNPLPEDPENYFQIIVKDSGDGFSKEYLDWYDEEEYPRPFKEHIGIKNTLWRLRLWYGRDCDLYLVNGNDGGAMVKLILPKGNKEFSKESY